MAAETDVAGGIGRVVVVLPEVAVVTFVMIGVAGGAAIVTVPFRGDSSIAPHLIFNPSADCLIDQLIG